ncbi:hypothetical protein [Paenibacillus sp. PAMC21692]|uniref:hypothetical protein n=1 Tax=Paenibacillus sp. PAMC21692 TaxID=2762320 RepID=UPI00164E9BC2|nr:hypothetical protein [Paenibacillus sp. PAMC21692]QNK57604.1 hypothetical protein H7F31_01070 [Paenibacillus sp. PAMC21692]
MATGTMQVGCSDEANKGKLGVNDIGYLCSVTITDQTNFRDEEGNSLTESDLSIGSTVKIILTEPVNIRRSFEKEEPLNLAAKEIILIQPDV